MQLKHKISEGTYHTYSFYCTTLNFKRKNADNRNAIIMSQKMERSGIDVYTEAILMHVLHFFSPTIAKNGHCALIDAR